MQYYYGNNFNGTGVAAPSVVSRTSGDKRSPREEPTEEMSESPQPDEVKAKKMKAKIRKEPKEKGTKKISKSFLNPEAKKGPSKKKSEELQVKLTPGLTLPKETATFSSNVGYPIPPAIVPPGIPPKELSQTTNHSAPISHHHLASKLVPNIPPPGYFTKMPQAMAYSQDHEMYKRYYTQQYLQQNPNQQQNPSQMNLGQMNPSQQPFTGQNPQNPAFMHQKPKETISPTLYQPPMPIQKYLMNPEGQNPNYGAMHQHQHQREQREGTPSEETMDRGGLNNFMKNMKMIANNNSSYLSMNPAKRGIPPQGPLIKMETPNEVTIQKNYVLMNPNQMGQMPPINQMGGYPSESNKPMMVNQINPMSNKNFEMRNPSEFPENMSKKNMPMSNMNFQRGPPGMYPPQNGMMFDCKYEAPNMNPNMGNLAMQQQAVKNYKGYPQNPYGPNVNNLPNNPNQQLGGQFQETLNNAPPQQSKTTPKKTHNFHHLAGKKMEERQIFDPKQGLPNNSQIGFEKQNYPSNYAMMPNYQMQNYGPNQEYKPMLYNPNMKQFYMGYPPKPNQNLPTNQSLSENDTNEDNSYAQRQKLMKMPAQSQPMSKPQAPAPQNMFHQMNMPNMNRQMQNANLPEILYKRMMLLNARKDGKEEVMSNSSDLFAKGMMKSGDDTDSNKKPMFNFDNEHMMKLFRKNKSDLGQEKKMNALLMELASDKKHYKEKKHKVSKITKEKTGKHGSKINKSSMNDSVKQALNINNDSSFNYPMNLSSNLNNNSMNMNNFINNPMNMNNSMNINNPLNMNPLGLKHSMSTPNNNNGHSPIINANGYPNNVPNNKVNNNNFNNNLHNNNINNNFNTNNMSPHSYVSTFSNNNNNANNNNDTILETNSLNNNKYNNYNQNNNNNNSFNNFNEETNANYKESPKDMILSNNPIFSSTEQKVGVLTVEERKMKIEKYLKKKRKRTWNRKINYFCRKQVADKRLRLKGRFMKKPKQDSFSELDRIAF